MKTYNEVIEHKAQDVFHSSMGGYMNPYADMNSDFIAFIYDRDAETVADDIKTAAKRIRQEYFAKEYPDMVVV